VSHAAFGPLAGIPLLEDLPDLRNRQVLVRVDFNVPLSEAVGPSGTLRVEDDFRIRAALPTLQWLLERGAGVTVCTHLGRPKGHPDPRFDLAPVRAVLAQLAPAVELRENLRFDPGEEANDPKFVARLIEGFDCYVNDAFGVSHRSHASVVGPPARLPSAAGRLLEREIEVLGGLLVHPEPPFVAVVGGSKVADKLGVLRALLEKVDRLIVGGGMAYTFLKAAGHQVGASLLDEAKVGECVQLLDLAGERILLPVDMVALSPGGTLGHGEVGAGEVRVFDGEVPEGWEAADIGPVTARRYADTLAGAGTIFWNGPMGVFEDERFAAGTRIVGEAVAAAAAYSVVGGGDSAAAVDGLGLADRIDFVSTGGGASLELLEHGDLPGLVALRGASNAPEAKS